MHKLKILLITMFFLSIGVNNSFAAGKDCANPTEITLKNEVKMKFCDIPAAQGVLIGSENGYVNEKPVKPRNFKKFQMSQFEVTQLQFKTLSGWERWPRSGTGKSIGDNYPAVHVNYNDIVGSFLSVLNSIDKTATYRLPTEAEFEYAARAGSPTNYYWGDNIDTDFAYFQSNSSVYGPYAREVDSCPNQELNLKTPGYCANSFGLYNMLGNVWEWTTTEYDSYENAPTDGNQIVIGNYFSIHPMVVRGGSWISIADYLRSSYRTYEGHLTDRYDLGFRVVRIPN